jgi:hypothetical protein
MRQEQAKAASAAAKAAVEAAAQMAENFKTPEAAGQSRA